MINALIGSHKKSLFIILTAAALFAPVNSMATAPLCSSVFTSDSQLLPAVNGQWRSGNANAFMGFRSNAPHFWSWLSNNQDAGVMAPRGTVAGDSHILNFGDVPLKNGGRKYTLVDVDDSGINSSLAGDFLRFYIGNQISPFKVKPKDLFLAYADGVKGKKMDKPDYLAKIEGASNKDFATRNNERIAKLTKGDKFSELAAVQPLLETSPEIQELFRQTSPAIQPYLNELTILDIGYKSKTTGGSQGLPRFWFLLEDSQSNRHIYEVKMEVEPATSLFTAQPDALTRLENVAGIYRPKDDVAGPYAFIKTESNIFLLRERFFNYIDFDPAKVTSEKGIADAKEMSLFLANRLGLAHGRQDSGNALKKELEKDHALEEIQHLAERYMALISLLDK